MEENKLVFQSNLKQKREEALKRRQEQVEKEKLEKQQKVSSQLLNLFDEDENSNNKSNKNEKYLELQEKLENVNPEEFFKQGGLPEDFKRRDQNSSGTSSSSSSSISNSSNNYNSYSSRDDKNRYPNNNSNTRDYRDHPSNRDTYRDNRDSRDSFRDNRDGFNRRRGDDDRNYNQNRDNRDNRRDTREIRNYDIRKPNYLDRAPTQTTRDSRDNRDNRDNRKDIDSINDNGKRNKEQMLEIQDIQNEYLGVKSDKKKKLKKSERNKFKFEWDSTEDTSIDYNSLYSNKTEIKPQFGRGNLAGFDDGNNPSTSSNKEIVNENHWSKKSVQQMSERDWRIFKEDFNITTKGNQIPNPMRSWREGNLPKQITDAINRLGYEKPSPIQMQSIPISLMGRDILGIAETGSGKTAAFVIPMLIYISKLPRLTKETEVEGPYALILAPTRELVQQIDKEIKSLSSYYGFRSVVLVGGLPIEDQVYQLNKGCEIVIATPGRLNDCLEKQYLVLNQCNYVVLDEADLMINLGFEAQVESILEAIPSTFLKSENEELARKQETDKNRVYRTTILFSATMPPFVEQISRKYLRRACHIIIGEAGKAVDRIKQTVIFVKSENDKKEQLGMLLASGPPPPIIIFVNKKIHCEIVASVVEESGLSGTILHSGKSQEQREYALDGFKRRRFNVLIATDVAARGIHVEGVTHVINFDMPNNIEDYTHRIGRTGRAGMEGLASSLIMDKDVEVMFDLKNMLTQTNNIVPIELLKHPASQQKHGTVSDKSQKRSETVIFK